MTLIWSVGAEADRLAIFQFAESDSGFAAQAIDAAIEEGAEQLLDTPDAGRPGIAPDTRELAVHPNYRLIYDTAGENIRVLALVHVRRQWPGE
jgi:toxin ParE1/3/4